MDLITIHYKYFLPTQAKATELISVMNSDTSN